ncbi:MAG TPA: hypothetical protein PKC90_01500 [Phycisphaerales bacterium]|nr:hypothetical protein [Phycisphaerales bacterium]
MERCPIAALADALERFQRTVEASTTPAPFGGRRVIGRPHAVALSEAHETVSHALTSLHEELRRSHAKRVPTPAEIVLLEADSPDGPWTRVPVEEIQAAILPFGGQDADARLIAAIEDCTEALAFPLRRWNELQANDPGAAHLRFEAGEGLDAVTLDRLNAAGAGLRLALSEPRGASLQRSITNPAEKDEPVPPPLTTTDVAVLAALATFNPARLATIAMVHEAMPPCDARSERTIGDSIKRLMTQGLVERTEGPRGGARLTMQGRRLVPKIAP